MTLHWPSAPAPDPFSASPAGWCRSISARWWYQCRCFRAWQWSSTKRHHPPPDDVTTHLVVVARSLAVLSEAFEGLVDEANVVLVDVEAEKTQAAGGAATNAVQELQRFAHQVVVRFVVLVPQVILQHTNDRHTFNPLKAPYIFPYIFIKSRK